MAPTHLTSPMAPAYLTELLLFWGVICLLGILYTLLIWYFSWRRFLREYREGQESLKKMLLGNFSNLIESLGRTPEGEEKNSPG
jgi:hypothetical protein